MHIISQVKLASAAENCSVVVVVWRSTRERGTAFSIKNDSDVPISVVQAGVFIPPPVAPAPVPAPISGSIEGTHQHHLSLPAPPPAAGEDADALIESVVMKSDNIDSTSGDVSASADAFAHPSSSSSFSSSSHAKHNAAAGDGAKVYSAAAAEVELQKSKYTVCVGPRLWRPFGWADPESDMRVTVTVGTPPFGPNPIKATVGLLKLNEITRVVIDPGDEGDADDDEEDDNNEGDDADDAKSEHGRNWDSKGSSSSNRSSAIAHLNKDDDDDADDNADDDTDSLAMYRVRNNSESEPRSRHNAAATSTSTSLILREGTPTGSKKSRTKRPRLEIFIAIQSLGSGKIIRVVRSKEDFDRLDMNLIESSGDDDDKGDEYTSLQVGGILGAAAVGFVVMGPLAPVALLGGAGIYY
jgi:hypothetical protein